MANVVTPLVLLALMAGPWLAARLLAPRLAPAAGRLGIALLFTFTGIGHFTRTAGMVAMLPAWLPAREPAVLVSGVVEIALGLAVLPARSRRAAGWLLVALLVAFLPVNVWAAWNRTGLGGHQDGPAYLLLRIPLQVAFAAWVIVFAARPGRDEPRAVGG